MHGTVHLAKTLGLEWVLMAVPSNYLPLHSRLGWLSQVKLFVVGSS